MLFSFCAKPNTLIQLTEHSFSVMYRELVEAKLRCLYEARLGMGPAQI